MSHIFSSCNLYKKLGKVAKTEKKDTGAGLGRDPAAFAGAAGRAQGGLAQVERASIKWTPLAGDRRVAIMD